MNTNKNIVRFLCIALCFSCLAPTLVLAEVDSATTTQEAASEVVDLQSAAEAQNRLEARMRLAQKFRDDEIDERNEYFIAKRAGDLGEPVSAEDCSFFCKVWRTFTAPFRMLGDTLSGLSM